MKEVKTFFVEDNSLNKGYAEDLMPKGYSGGRKRVNDLLPPPDVLAVYEEMYPGTFRKLLDALDKEQKHQHNMQELQLQMHSRARRIGRICGLLSLVVIGYVVTKLALAGMLEGALGFAAVAFLAIYMIARVNGACAPRKIHHDKPFRNNRPPQGRNIITATSQIETPSAPVVEKKVYDNKRRRRR